MHRSAKLQLQLLKKVKKAPGVFSFYFSFQTFSFTAGQYIQLILPHDADERGTTRFFSITSSPQEKHLMLTIKEGRSSFKRRLFALEPGTKIDAFGPMGKFVLEN